mgnify:CR=1 FL=1
MKQLILMDLAFAQVSPPVRRRGLKLLALRAVFSAELVASRAEAWIETYMCQRRYVRIAVASRAEAWIETSDAVSDPPRTSSRLPCGGVD